MPTVVVPWLRGPLDCDVEETDMPVDWPKMRAPLPSRRPMLCAGGCGKLALVGPEIVEWAHTVCATIADLEVNP